MSSSAHGKNISDAEVTHVSSHGLWLLAEGREFFMSFEDFPWFRNRPTGELLNVETLRKGHFYWPDIDVDLSIEIIEHPKKYPLTAKAD